jgi:NitT/TauT family transport system substrate-binding protein
MGSTLPEPTRAGEISRARALSLVFGAAALSATRGPARAQTNPTLRIGILPVESAATVFYAKDLGFFTKAGLDADIQPMPNTPAIAAAVVSGAIDFGYVTIDSIATIHQQHIPLVVVAPAAEYLYPAGARTVGVIVTPNSPIHSAKDLEGKVVALPAVHSLGSTALSTWMDANGASSAAVKYVEIPFPAMAPALDAGRIDAAFEVEPFFGAAMKHDRVLTDAYSSISKHFLLSVWVAETSWAKAHPDLVRRFAGVIHEASVWANKNQDQSGQILAKYTKIDPTLLATMARGRYAEQLTPSVMQPGIDASAKYNNFTAFPAAELIYVPPR